MAMDKKTIWIVIGTVIVTLIIAPRLKGLPGLNKLPTV